MYKRGTDMVMSDFYCEVCGFHMPLPRPRSKTREKGHFKTMNCIKCGKERRFREVRNKDFTLSHVI